MATSGTTSFTLDLSDIMEEAYERAGLELRSGYDYKTARITFNRPADLKGKFEVKVIGVDACGNETEWKRKMTFY